MLGVIQCCLSGMLWKIHTANAVKLKKQCNILSKSVILQDFKAASLKSTSCRQQLKLGWPQSKFYNSFNVHIVIIFYLLFIFVSINVYFYVMRIYIYIYDFFFFPFLF